jgi:outer membrane receptor protein involved in Fe transport
MIVNVSRWVAQLAPVCRLFCGVPLGLIAYLLASPGVCATSLDRRIQFDIRAGTHLDDALFIIAKQTHLDIQITDSPALDRIVRELRGTFRARDALTLLLQDSGLVSEVAGHTIYVRLGTSAPALPAEGAEFRQTMSQGRAPGWSSTRGVDGQRETAGNEPGTDEIVVTGSRIRGVSSTLPVVVLTQDDIKNCACQTVPEVLATLPQNQAGSFNSAIVGGAQSTTPLSGASAVNLRGLGVGATLTLVDGRRLPPNQGSGGTDVSQIPLAAVERIEVNPAGASAAYGSDAVAGVVNIIIRDQYQGAEVHATVGGTMDGGGFTRRFGAGGGYGWTRGNAFGASDCERQNAIDATERHYVASALSRTTLLPYTQLCSVLLNAKQALAKHVDATFLAGYTARSNSQSANIIPSSESLFVTTAADAHQFFVGTNITAKLSGSWNVGLDADVSSDSVTGSELLAPAGAPPMREADTFDNGLRSVEVVLDGTLLKRRVDALKLATGAGYRQETFRFDNEPATESTIYSARHVKFVFVEGHIPLLLSDEVDGPHSLTLSLAGRREYYSDVGSTSIPQFSIKYRPLPVLSILASWGRSFRAPTLLQEHNPTQLTLETISDSSAPSGESLGLLRFGGNPRLRPERSRTASLDLTLNPRAWPGATFELTYYNTFYDDRIEYPSGDTGNPLADSNLWPFVQRNPSVALISQLIAQSQYLDLTKGKSLPGSAGLVIDDRYQNIVQQHLSGVDLHFSYQHDLGNGHFGTTLNVAYLDLRQRVTSDSQTLELSGTVFNPPDYRGRFGVNWSNPSYSAALFLNETGPSRDPDSDPPQRLSAWTTVDAQVAYTLPRHGSGGTTRVTLAARNIFDRPPPLLTVKPGEAPAVNFDWANASGVGCFITLQTTHSF